MYYLKSFGIHFGASWTEITMDDLDWFRARISYTTLSGWLSTFLSRLNQIHPQLQPQLQPQPPLPILTNHNEYIKYQL